MKSGLLGVVTFKGAASLTEVLDVAMPLGEREITISPVVEMLLPSSLATIWEPVKEPVDSC